jgi:5'-nucleotidase
VKKAYHGTRELDFDAQRKAYSRETVELADRRWVFLNTLFSLSEACMYMQLVDLLDQRLLPEVLGYSDLYQQVRKTLDAAHMEGQLKAEIVANPERFVDTDEDTVLALLDQKHAGKKLLLVTNSEWPYTTAMMTFAFDRFLPKGETWRSLFHLVIVSAQKPEFFSTRMPVFEVQTDTGLLKPFPPRLEAGGVYHGGNAGLVEAHLGVSGDDILYVGDHMFTDVHASKSVLRWRTALILREIEGEVAGAEEFLEEQRKLISMMQQKTKLEYRAAQLRLMIQRHRNNYGPKPPLPLEVAEKEAQTLRQQTQELDTAIAPLAKVSSGLGNNWWGPLMRAGNDKSHLARQVERYADVYMSRVSNFLFQSPFTYLRSHRGSMPHDALE